MVGLIDNHQLSSDQTDLGRNSERDQKVSRIIDTAVQYFPCVSEIKRLVEVTEGKSGYPVYLVDVVRAPLAVLKMQLRTVLTQQITDEEQLHRLLSHLPQPLKTTEAVSRLSTVPLLTLRLDQLIEQWCETDQLYDQITTAFETCFEVNGTQHTPLRPKVQGLHYLKIRELKDETDYAWFLQLLDSQAPIHQKLMTRPADYKVVDKHLIILYPPAHQSLDNEKVCSLTLLSRKWGTTAAVKRALEYLCSRLEACYQDAHVHTDEPRNLLVKILRDRRVNGDKSVMERTAELLRRHRVDEQDVERVKDASCLYIGGDMLLPNPVAYIKHPEYWQVNRIRSISLRMAIAHDDLHCENIICNLLDEKHPVEVIDFDDPREGEQSVFADFLYLELDLILRVMRPRDGEKLKDIALLISKLMDKVTIPAEDELPPDALNIASHLRPLRDVCARMIYGFKDYQEDYENGFWLTATAVGLNYLRKESLSLHERTLGWLYAAHALKRVLRYHGIAYDQDAQQPFSLAWINNPKRKADDPERLQDEYLNYLIERLDKFDLAQLTNTNEPTRQLSLSRIYVPLETQYQVSTAVRDGRLDRAEVFDRSSEARASIMHRGDEDTRTPLPSLTRDIERDPRLIEQWHEYLTMSSNGAREKKWAVDVNTAAALAKYVIVSGNSGSGKSTILRYLALYLISLQPRNRLSGSLKVEFWPHGALMPIFISFSNLVNDPGMQELAARKPDLAGEITVDFTENFQRFLVKELPENLRPYVHLLDEQLHSGKAMLFLDGVDEVSDFMTRQHQIRTLLSLVCEVYPKCRVIVSTRTSTLSNQWHPRQFVHVQLTRLGDKARQQLAHNLFKAVIIPHDRMESELNGFLDWVRNLDEAISAIPLFFSLMMAIWIDGSERSSKLTTKGAIYRASVDILINRWHQRNGSHSSRLDEIGMAGEQLRALLEVLAYGIHSETLGNRNAEFESGRIMTLLRRLFKPRLKVDYDALVDTLARSGLIEEVGDEKLKFTHLSFQEHLAASYAARPPHFPDLIMENIRENPQLWRDVVELLPDEAGHQRQDLWLMLKRMLDEAEQQMVSFDTNVTPHMGYGAYFAVRMLENHPESVYQEVKQGRLDQLRRLMQYLVTTGSLNPADRVEMGDLLAKYGDERKGVGLNTEGLPDIAWCAVPAGKVVISALNGREKNREWEVKKPFFISRYPITVAQFRAFADSEDYHDHVYWNYSDIPQELRERPRDLDKQPANQPVVHVSWYQAVAFCRWLSSKLFDGNFEAIRLPKETQWERAAAGLDQKLRTAGLSAELGNTAITQVGRICAVGMFPQGESDFLVRDMIGNVSEWCRSEFNKPDYDLSHDTPRGVRGGAFMSTLERGEIPRERLASNTSQHDNRWGLRSTGFRVVTELAVPTINDNERTTQISTVTQL